MRNGFDDFRACSQRKQVMFWACMVCALSGLLAFSGKSTQAQGQVSKRAPDQEPYAQIGVPQAIKRFGPNTPRGFGVVVGHVEGDLKSYGPNPAAQTFRLIEFDFKSGRPKEPTGHADAVAHRFYGTKGVAVGVQHVQLFPSNNWLSQGYLNVGTGQPPVDDALVRVWNHSWIGSPSEAMSLQILARSDYLADMYDVQIVCGVNNGGNQPVPYILGSAYNVLAVGTAGDVGSSDRYTQIDTPGRCKPDVVGPDGQTSFTTPLVAGVVTCLLEQADRMKSTVSTAGRSEVIRSVIQAGAVKLRKWQPEPGKPLDRRLGAGVVNLNNALQIIKNPFKAGAKAEKSGWWCHGISPGREVTHQIELTRDSELCLSLNWNRRVQGIWVSVRKPQGSGANSTKSQAKSESKSQAKSQRHHHGQALLTVQASMQGSAQPQVEFELDQLVHGVDWKNTLGNAESAWQWDLSPKSEVNWECWNQFVSKSDLIHPVLVDGQLDAQSPRQSSDQAIQEFVNPRQDVVRVWVPRPYVCDLDLKLEKQTENGWEVISESKSRVDNIEYIYSRRMPAGHYRVTVRYPDQMLTTPTGDGLPELTKPQPWIYALSCWIGSPTERFVQPSQPTGGSGQTGLQRFREQQRQKAL